MNGKFKDYGFIYLLLFLLIIGISVLFYKKHNSTQINKKICLKYVQSSFNGVVDSCFFDFQNKGTFTFILIDNNLFYTFPAAVISHPENYLDKNDSIIKKHGDAKYCIYKNRNPASLVILEFDCSFWDSKYNSVK
jgi:hypothetical protein